MGKSQRGNNNKRNSHYDQKSKQSGRRSGRTHRADLKRKNITPALINAGVKVREKKKVPPIEKEKESVTDRERKIYKIVQMLLKRKVLKSAIAGRTFVVGALSDLCR